MLKTILATIMLPLVLGSQLISADSDAKAPTDEELIRQLGSSKFTEREQAAKVLQASGPKILPALQKAANHPDAEVRRRVQTLIPAIKAAAAFEPKRIRLKPKKRTMAEILKEIQEQTGYQLFTEDEIDEKKIFEEEMKNALFWEAVDQIRCKTDLVVASPDLEHGKLTKEYGVLLKKRALRPHLVVDDGPFRVELKQVHEDRDIDFGRSHRDYLLTLTFTLIEEPKLTLLGAQVAEGEALDDEKNILRSFLLSADRRKELQRRNRMEDSEDRFTTQMFLHRSSDKAKTLSTLRGTIPIHVAIDRTPVIVTENILAAQGAKCKVGSDSITIKRVKQKEEDLEIEIAHPPEPEDADFCWRYRIHVEDANGKRFEADYTKWSTGDEPSVSFTYNKSANSKLGPPKKLIVDDWTVLQHLVHFEFKDVPLP